MTRGKAVFLHQSIQADKVGGRPFCMGKRMGIGFLAIIRRVEGRKNLILCQEIDSGRLSWRQAIRQHFSINLSLVEAVDFNLDLAAWIPIQHGRHRHRRRTDNTQARNLRAPHDHHILRVALKNLRERNGEEPAARGAQHHDVCPSEAHWDGTPSGQQKITDGGSELLLMKAKS